MSTVRPAMQQRDVINFHTSSGEVVIHGWLHEDGESLTRVTWQDSLGRHSARYLTINDVERLVRGLQRWLQEVREHGKRAG